MDRRYATATAPEMAIQSADGSGTDEGLDGIGGSGIPEFPVEGSDSDTELSPIIHHPSDGTVNEPEPSGSPAGLKSETDKRLSATATPKIDAFEGIEPPACGGAPAREPPVWLEGRSPATT